jgi:carbamoyltransferase
MNTSFNIRGEPIVTTVEEALKCYFTTDMDALAIGPFLLKKPGKC